MTSEQLCSEMGEVDDVGCHANRSDYQSAGMNIDRSGKRMMLSWGLRRNGCEVVACHALIDSGKQAMHVRTHADMLES